MILERQGEDLHLLNYSLSFVHAYKEHRNHQFPNLFIYLFIIELFNNIII